jgi:glycosyltransferase A (GT-A) superfamily protein (DUF2064 family)
MRRALAASGPGPAVLVGSDIPGLTATHIAAAFRLLGRHDVVFGPARDGGFWLVGCRHRAPDFGEVRWSSRHALADTLANLPKSLSVGFAATLDDIDDGAAYRRSGVFEDCRAEKHSAFRHLVWQIGGMTLPPAFAGQG